MVSKSSAQFLRNEKLDLVYFSLVILTFCFKATRGLFSDGHRNFEPRSDDENDTCSGIPAPHQREDVWPPTYDLTIRDGSSVELGFELEPYGSQSVRENSWTYNRGNSDFTVKIQ
ncbi:hypothetical protein AVEN_269363-1 [Araneus ventricosus]|uniref:Uncharacterized protein n=1 Tax=Araneus ventricosus TaxID=182803 RepID=A0A4Y2JGB2_ARAVE|nr:hypothetical protein AVEN_269363-1 [Araneus ventricosus]